MVHIVSLLAGNGFRKALLQHLFKEGNVEYYTHQPRDEKSYTVVIKNLHATISTDDTKDELQNIGFKVRNVVYIRA